MVLQHRFSPAFHDDAKGVSAGIATYAIGGPGAITQIDEHTDIYTSVNSTRHGTDSASYLSFR